jgi:hypothetical protein
MVGPQLACTEQALAYGWAAYVSFVNPGLNIQEVMFWSID